MIASVDVEQAAAGFGLTRSSPAVAQPTLVANPAGFQPQIFQKFKTVHPAATYLERVYIADTHGRVWKFLTAAPDVAIPFADLGQDQPVGTAAALNGLPLYNESTGQTNPVPYVHVTSGNDSRAQGPFKIFAFRDDGDKVSTATGPSVTANEVTSFPPAVSLYTRTFDPGTPQADCGYTDGGGLPRHRAAGDHLRGPDGVTVRRRQSAGCSSAARGSACPTRSSPRPRRSPAAQGTYPCRSQFDSIVYALGDGDRRRRLRPQRRPATTPTASSATAGIVGDQPCRPTPTRARGGSRFNARRGADQGPSRSRLRRPACRPRRPRPPRTWSSRARGGTAGADDPVRRRRSASRRGDAEAVRGSSPRGWAPWPFGRGGVPGRGCPISLQASLEVATGVTFRS